MPLQALLLSDGIPGHFRCAEGVLAAVARLQAVTVTEVKVRRPRTLTPSLLSILVNNHFTPEAILRWIYCVHPSSLPKIDLIVSAGGDTLAPSIALARLTGAPNIFFGSLRRFKAIDFTLALNAYTTENSAANQIRILKPSPADPAKLTAPHRDDHNLPGAVGLLIGGPSGDAQYTELDWTHICNFLEETHRRCGMAWIVSNSRRTPTAVSDRLAALAVKSGTPIRRFIDVRTAGPGSLAELFEESGAVLVTADSSAMLSEAIWMRRPAVALRPKSLALPPKEVEYRRWLDGQNLCRELALSDVTPEQLTSVLREIVPLTENPQVKLAQLLERQLPELFST